MSLMICNVLVFLGTSCPDFHLLQPASEMNICETIDIIMKERDHSIRTVILKFALTSTH